MSLTDIIDNTFYEIHRLPAKAFYGMFNWTKYTTSKIETSAGYGALASYLGSIITLSFSGDYPFQPFDHGVMLGGGLFLGVVYGVQLAKNYKESEIARKREDALESQMLEGVIDYEETLQRYNRRKEAPWYALSMPLWAGFIGLYSFLGGIDITDPMIITMGVSAIASTNFLYGARYVLTTELNKKKPRKNKRLRKKDEIIKSAGSRQK
ncbi:MAG: hypothetical protein ACLFPQ_01990 [Candidatus Woesearchaeota archaeon]